MKRSNDVRIIVKNICVTSMNVRLMKISVELYDIIDQYYMRYSDIADWF